MLDPKLIDDLARQLGAGMPRGLQTLQDDVKQNLKSGLEASLAKLNLVTREEFDVQQAVLLRTREKLRALEARVAILESERDD